MKKQFLSVKKFGLLAAAALCFVATSCSDDDNVPETPVCPPAQTPMYMGGFYVVNEGWLGHEPGSVNYYKDGEFSYSIYAENNPGETLGNTTTNLVQEGDYVYMVSKDEPCLVKAGVYDFKKQASVGKEAFGGQQAYNFGIANSESGVVTGWGGAFVVSLSDLSVTKTLTSDYTGDIVRAGGNLCLIANKSAGSVIDVYDAETLELKKAGVAGANTGFAVAKDGSIWAAMGGSPELVKVDPSSLEAESIEVGVNVYYNSTYTPGALAVSVDENAVFFASGSKYNAKEVYKYDIEAGSVSKIYTCPENYSLYGQGICMNPSTGDLYVICTEDGWGEHYLNTYIRIIDSKTGVEKGVIDYSGHYWFPSKLVFN